MMIMPGIALTDWSQLALKILLTGILFIILAVICILLITRIQRWLTVENKREHVVKLTNQGNFTSVFNLSVVSVEQIFSFNLLLNDIPLIAVPQVEISQPLSADVNTAPSEQPAQKNKAEKKAEIKADKKTSAAGGVLKGGQAVAAKAGMLASFIGTLASLLPGSWGSNLRAQSETLREAQSNAQAATQAPIDAQRRVESLQQQGGKLSGVTPAAKTGNLPNVNVQRPEARSSAPASVHSQSERPMLTAARKVTPGVYMVQTQPVEPGADLSLVLRIEALKRSRPDGTFAYTLSSQQLPVETLEGEQPPVIKQGVLHFPHIHIWRYWLAPVANLLVIATLLSTLIFVVGFIWN